MANMSTMWPIIALMITSLVLIIASTHTSAAKVVDTTRETVSSKHHIRSNTNANTHSNTRTTKKPSSADTGIYFDDDSPIDDEGEGSGSNFDDTETSSGKGDDDEDSPMIPGAKEGSGSHPVVTGSVPGSTSNPNSDEDDDDSDIDDEDQEFGSGDDDFEPVLSTERPTKRPDVPIAPEVPTPESKPKPKDPIEEPFDNSVPKEAFPPKVLPPSETSTRYPLPASTQWPPHRGPTDTEDDGNQLGNDVSIMGQKQVTPASFFARPGILAAVIGGAVVGLLCAILLVMFIVYRMRKKDEGSYALDEPKRQTSVNPYARGSSKEFFA